MNVGNDGEHTMLELAQRVLNLTASDSPIVHRPLPEDDPTRRKPDLGLARERLGYSPRVTLDDGLGRTIEYFRERLTAREVR